MKKLGFTTLMLVILIAIIVASVYFFSHRSLFLTQKPSESSPITFPLLIDEIHNSGVQIEEIDSSDLRTYILHATITQPFSKSGIFLTGVVKIKGDPNNTLFYINAGPLNGEVYFGTTSEGKLTWRYISTQDFSKLINNQNNLLVYWSFPKELSNFESKPNSFKYAKHQQDIYKLVQQIIRHESSVSPVPVEVQTNQIGIDK